MTRAAPGRQGRTWCGACRWLRVPDWAVQLPILWLVSGAYWCVARADLASYLAVVGLASLCQALLLPGGYLANDFFDRHQDRVRDDREPLTKSDAARKAVASALLLSAGLVVAHVAGRRAPATPWIAWAQVLLGIAYSSPGSRLKERGAAGILAAALLQRVPAFAIVALAFPLRVIAAASLAAWLAALGLVTILEHQLADERSDRASGVSTWALALGPVAARRMRRRFYGLWGAATLVAVASLALEGRGGLHGAAVLAVAGLGFLALAPRRLDEPIVPEAGKPGPDPGWAGPSRRTGWR